MYTETISLSSIDAVKKFVCIANEYDFTINLLSDKYKIDAKSIMSVFSLDPVSYTHLDVYKRQDRGIPPCENQRFVIN